MNNLRCTLLTDGSSDMALMPILQWLLREQGIPANIVWADLRHLAKRPVGLSQKILAAIDLYPCDVLFIHRDAEAQPPEQRYNEIRTAIEKAQTSAPHVCVVPIRMQEAWFLLDELAIRKASGNPNGRMPIPLPPLEDIETLPNPKQVLYDAIKTASGCRGRRLKKLRPERLVRRVSDFIENYTNLRVLSAFQQLEKDVRALNSGGRRRI